MALIWVVPSALTVLAAVLAGHWLKAVATETERVQQELRTLPILAERGRAVRAEAERAARAANSTGDFFGRDRRQ